MNENKKYLMSALGYEIYDYLGNKGYDEHTIDYIIIQTAEAIFRNFNQIKSITEIIDSGDYEKEEENEK